MGDQFSSGATISHYKIISKIGQGGMGAVYKAEDTKLRRPVALKFLLREKFSSIDKQRFLREAQAAAALHHPNICTIYEVDEANGEIFFAMAYLEGQTLAARIAAGAVEFDQALELGIQLADALEEAHIHGIVHRDIKSNNILLTPKNQAVILDFGLAQISGASKLTKTGATLGTAAYMSPEHARGLDVDHRGDLWSLAVVIYELATGQLPFRATQDLAMLYCIVNEPHVPACQSRPSLPPRFDDIMNLALAKDPDDRYQHASELATDLRRLKNLIGIETLATGKIEPLPPRPPRKSRRVLLGSAAAAVAVAAVLGLWQWTQSGGFLKSEAPGLAGPVNARHVAVMPLRYVGSAPGQEDEAYCAGLGEWLGDRLAALQSANDSLIVVEPAEVRAAGITGVSEAREIFGVSRVLTGSAERDAAGWRIALNLVDAASVRQVQSIEARANGIGNPDAARELVAKAVGMIGVDSTASAGGPGRRDGPRQAEPGEAFIKGLGFFRRAAGRADLRSAVGEFEHALEANPRNAQVLSYLALARLRLAGSSPDSTAVKAALAEARQAVDLEPSLTEAHAALGAALARLDRNEAALDEFRQALGIDPLDALARRGLVDALLALGRKDEAESALTEYRRRRPTDVRAHLEIAGYYADWGRLADAEREYRAALELTPVNQAIPVQLAGLYRRLGRLDQAKAQVERSLAIRASAEGYAALGGIELQAGRYLQAATAYEMATEMNPASHEFWGALGDCYRHSPGSEGQSRAAFGRAIDLARRDLAVTGESADSRSRLALYLAKSGQLAGAQKELDAIPSAEANGAAVLLRSAVVHELAGDRGRASRELRAAIDAGATTSQIEGEPDLGGVPR